MDEIIRLIPLSSRRSPLTPSEIDALLKGYEELAVVESYAQELAKTKPPPLIYHYTGRGGLEGILESGTLWVTNIFSLNDPSELRHGVSYACELLNRAASTPRASRVLRAFAAAVTNSLTLRIEEVGQFFICCFSDDGDDLGQWRLYADDGKGYALGFDAHVLEQSFVNDAASFRATFPLSYEEADLHKMQSQIVDAALRVIETAEGVLTEAHLRTLLSWFSIHVIRAALFFKHRGYRNEKEYRFLQLYGVDRKVPDLATRGAKLSALLHWRRDAPAALKKIIVGPAAGPSGLKHAQESIRRFHSSAVEIEQSPIPYRSFR